MTAMRYITFDNMILKFFSAFEERFELHTKSLDWDINNLKLVFFWKILFNFPTYCPEIGERPPGIKSDGWKQDYERLKGYWTQGRYHPFTRALRAEEIFILDMLQVFQYDTTIRDIKDNSLLPDKSLWKFIQERYPDLKWPPYQTPIDTAQWLEFLQEMIHDVI